MEIYCNNNKDGGGNISVEVVVGNTACKTVFFLHLTTLSWHGNNIYKFYRNIRFCSCMVSVAFDNRNCIEG